MLRHRHRSGTTSGMSGTVRFLLVPVARTVRCLVPSVRCLVPGYGSRAYYAGGTVALIFFLLLLTHTFLLTVLTQQYYYRPESDMSVVDSKQLNEELTNEEKIYRLQRIKDNSSKASKHLLAASEYNYDKNEQSLSENTQQKNEKNFRQLQSGVEPHQIETFVVNVETIQDRRKPRRVLAPPLGNSQIQGVPKSPYIPLNTQGEAKVNRQVRQYKNPESVVEVNIDREKRDEDWEAHEDMSLEHLIVASSEDNKNIQSLKTQQQQQERLLPVKQAENHKRIFQQRLAEIRKPKDPLLIATTKAPAPNLLKQAQLRLSLQMRKRNRQSMFQKPALIRQPVRSRQYR